MRKSGTVSYSEIAGEVESVVLVSETASAVAALSMAGKGIQHKLVSR